MGHIHLTWMRGRAAGRWFPPSGVLLPGWRRAARPHPPRLSPLSVCAAQRLSSVGNASAARPLVKLQAIFHSLGWQRQRALWSKQPWPGPDLRARCWGRPCTRLPRAHGVDHPTTPSLQEAGGGPRPRNYSPLREGAQRCPGRRARVKSERTFTCG